MMNSKTFIFLVLLGFAGHQTFGGGQAVETDCSEWECGSQPQLEDSCGDCREGILKPNDPICQYCFCCALKTAQEPPSAVSGQTEKITPPFNQRPGEHAGADDDQAKRSSRRQIRCQRSRALRSAQQDTKATDQKFFNYDSCDWRRRLESEKD
ncbi:unnamed protein product [Cyprideis torosa]|uniref:Uncharacterized protein n=1 Tax=Cyprideis torosa TaxID=163714 RepID=A0A7R8WGB4_9CRUS|nr:unnamed protein product [Cyprideis torosa]CAG0895139.1 unnamed protein product [Cyprideis torosa]